MPPKEGRTFSPRPPEGVAWRYSSVIFSSPLVLGIHGMNLISRVAKAHRIKIAAV